MFCWVFWKGESQVKNPLFPKQMWNWDIVDDSVRPLFLFDIVSVNIDTFVLLYLNGNYN